MAVHRSVRMILFLSWSLILNQLGFTNKSFLFRLFRELSKKHTNWMPSRSCPYNLFLSLRNLATYNNFITILLFSILAERYRFFFTIWHFVQVLTRIVEGKNRKALHRVSVGFYSHLNKFIDLFLQIPGRSPASRSFEGHGLPRAGMLSSLSTRHRALPAGFLRTLNF